MYLNISNDLFYFNILNLNIISETFESPSSAVVKGAFVASVKDALLCSSFFLHRNRGRPAKCECSTNFTPL